MAFLPFSDAFSESPAVSWNKRTLTYAELEVSMRETIDKLSGQLQSRRKNLVMLCLPRSLEEYILTLSLLEMDQTGLNVGQEQSPKQIEELLKRFPVKHIITHKKFLKLYFSNFPNTEYFELTQDIVILENIFFNESHLPVPDNCKWTLSTSGSQGTPKIVMISSAELHQRALGEIRDFNIAPGDRLLNFLSFSHDLGLNQLLSAFMGRACLFIHKYIFLNDLLEQIQQDKITGLTSIANIWREFLKKNTEFDFSSTALKYFTISGESLNHEELNCLMKKAGAQLKIYRTYGQTETFRSLICATTTDFSTGVPLKDVKFKLHFHDNEQVGELIHYGAGTMLGYLNDPCMTEEKFTPDGGVRTGDFFTVSEKGFYQFVSRKDDMKKLNGIRFYPSQIENALLKHPSISDACLFLLKDINENDVAVAVISTVIDIDDKTIRDFLSPYLPALFIPHHYLRLQTFPRAHSAKINRKELQELASNFLLKI